MALLNILQLLSGDDQQTFTDKVNFNFDQVLSFGGGPQGLQGIQGIQGIVGPQGLQGFQGNAGLNGSKLFVQPASSTPVGAVTGDIWIHTDDLVTQTYNGVSWVTTGLLTLTGPFTNTSGPNNVMLTTPGSNRSLVLSSINYGGADSPGTTFPYKLKLVAPAGQRMMKFAIDGETGIAKDPGSTNETEESYQPFIQLVQTTALLREMKLRNPHGDISIETPDSTTGINLSAPANLTLKLDGSGVPTYSFNSPLKIKIASDVFFTFSPIAGSSKIHFGLDNEVSTSSNRLFSISDDGSVGFGDVYNPANAVTGDSGARHRMDSLMPNLGGTGGNLNKHMRLRSTFDGVNYDLLEITQNRLFNDGSDPVSVEWRLQKKVNNTIGHYISFYGGAKTGGDVTGSAPFRTNTPSLRMGYNSAINGGYYFAANSQGFVGIGDNAFIQTIGAPGIFTNPQTALHVGGGSGAITLGTRAAIADYVHEVGLWSMTAGFNLVNMSLDGFVTGINNSIKGRGDSTTKGAYSAILGGSNNLIDFNIGSGDISSNNVIIGGDSSTINTNTTFSQIIGGSSNLIPSGLTSVLMLNCFNLSSAHVGATAITSNMAYSSSITLTVPSNNLTIAPIIKAMNGQASANPNFARGQSIILTAGDAVGAATSVGGTVNIYGGTHFPAAPATIIGGRSGDGSVVMAFKGAGKFGGVSIGTSTANSNTMLEVTGNFAVNTYDIFLAGPGDFNHGLGWYGSAVAGGTGLYTSSNPGGKGLNGDRKFAGINIDGPVIFGFSGGALGVRKTGSFFEGVSLTWDANATGSKGQIRIGDGTAPAAPADVRADSGTGKAIQLDASAYGGRKWALGDGMIGTSGNGVFAISDVTAGAVRISIDGSNGNVGIGTGSPAFPLEVRTVTNSYGITHSDGTRKLSTYIESSTNSVQIGSSSNHDLKLFTNNATRITIDAAEGNTNIESNDIHFVSGSSAQGIGVYNVGFNSTKGTSGDGKFAGVNFGGPILYGDIKGGLGTKTGGDKIISTWTDQGVQTMNPSIVERTFFAGDLDANVVGMTTGSATGHLQVKTYDRIMIVSLSKSGSPGGNMNWQFSIGGQFMCAIDYDASNSGISTVTIPVPANTTLVYQQGGSGVSGGSLTLRFVEAKFGLS